MTPEAQRKAIAKACGWELEERFDGSFKDPSKQVSRGKAWKHPNGYFAFIPDYLNDLNAMHEAEKVMKAEQQDIYACVLEEMITPDFLGDQGELDPHIIMFRDIHASAAQRAEAFLRTLGLWKNTKKQTKGGEQKWQIKQVQPRSNRHDQCRGRTRGQRRDHGQFRVTKSSTR